jgi:hypothetical protein
MLKAYMALKRVGRYKCGLLRSNFGLQRVPIKNLYQRHNAATFTYTPNRPDERSNNDQQKDPVFPIMCGIAEAIDSLIQQHIDDLSVEHSLCATICHEHRQGQRRQADPCDLDLRLSDLIAPSESGIWMRCSLIIVTKRIDRSPARLLTMT